MSNERYARAREYTCKLLADMDSGTLDPRTVANMALEYLSESDVKAMCLANDLYVPEEPETNAVKDAYEGGVCPDCGEEIPDDVDEGEDCSNCGHTFHSEQKAN